jgi:4-amino-4-deoxy-L-arabinose transferase-like glycosyltransferase
VEGVRRPTSKLKVDAAIAAALFLLALLAVAFTLGHYGFTYDEPIYISLGTRMADWTVSLLSGDFSSALDQKTIDRAWYHQKDMQPPLAQLLFGLSQRLLGLPRLPGAFFFAAIAAALYLFGSRHFGRTAGLFASLSFLSLPRLFAHAHYAALDTAAAALVLLAALAVWKLFETGRWSWTLAAGLLFGLALLTKLTAITLLLPLFIYLLLFSRARLAGFLIACLGLSPLVFLLGWPWLWHDTWARLASYLSFHLHHYPVAIYYLGRTHLYAPWHYPLVITAITTPTSLLALMLLGLWRGLRRHFRPALFVLLCGGSFLLASSLPTSPKYNGIRLFLPAFPFLCLLAGIGFSWLSRLLFAWASRRPSLSRASALKLEIAALLAALLLLAPLRSLIGYHPYQLAYYNALVGGPQGALARGFETIYWGGPFFDPALQRLFAHYPQARVFVTPHGVIGTLLAQYQQAGLIPPTVEFSAGADPEARAREIARCDFVIFQVAQSEFDEVSRPLFDRGQPLPDYSRYLDEAHHVPLLLVFPGEEARRLLGIAPAVPR